jgi:hypothetical protein
MRKQANYDGSADPYKGGGSKGEYRRRTLPVDSFEPSPGVCTMSTATYGNGRRTAGPTATPATPEMVAQGQGALAPCG